MIESAKCEVIHAAIRQAQKDWLSAFDAHDADGCAALYEPNAVLRVVELGKFTRREQIQAFWQSLIDSGFANYEILDAELEIVDENSAFVSMTWQMNKVFGKISKAHWVLQPDNSVLMREQTYEIYGERVDISAGASVSDVFDLLSEQSIGQSD